MHPLLWIGIFFALIGMVFIWALLKFSAEISRDLDEPREKKLPR